MGAGREILQRDMFWANGRVHYLDHSGSFPGVHRCQNASNIHFEYVRLIVANYTFTEAVLKNGTIL